MDPLVSVIMSVYNDEKYVSQAIESILLQSFDNFEFLIIDDSSDDGSYEIIKSFSNENPKIKFFRNNERKGLTRNLNSLLKLTSGKYIARMDSDDLSDLNRFKYQIDFLKKTDFDLVFTQAKIISPEGNYICDYYSPPLNYKIKKINYFNYFIHPTVMFKREIIKKKNFYDEKYLGYEDWELWVRLLKQGYRMGEINKNLYYYRYVPGSTTKSIFKFFKGDNLNLAWVLVCYFNQQPDRARHLANKSNRIIRLFNMVVNIFPLSWFIKIREMRYFLIRKLIHKF